MNSMKKRTTFVFLTCREIALDDLVKMTFMQREFQA